MFRQSAAGIGCLAILAVLVGAVGGISALHWFVQDGQNERREYRLNGAAPIRPRFLGTTNPCRPRSPNEIALDRAMLTAWRAAAPLDRGAFNPVRDDVVSYFAWHWLLAGEEPQPISPDGRHILSCPPSRDLVLQLLPALDRHGWPQSNTQLNDLRLVESLPPSEARAKGLARIALSRWGPPSDSQSEDVRPYARQLLGDQGKFARPWRDQALAQIGGDTRLGTSAAYLAVGADSAAALSRVERAMAAKLDASRKRKTKAYATGGDIPAIRDDDGNRLIELGYALARGGKSAQPYSAPIIAMLDEVIARSAPPFGLMAAKPTEFCRIALHIGGRPAAAANAKYFCAPAFSGGDGAPRQF